LQDVRNLATAVGVLKRFSIALNRHCEERSDEAIQ
jgi:hypothetical protein